MNYLLLFCLLLCTTVNGYHILCLFQVPSRSHDTLGKGVVNALLKSGHEVTWATPFPPTEKVPNLNIIDVSATKKVLEEFDMSNIQAGKADFNVVKQYSWNITKITLGVPAIRDAITKGRYDAVVTESFLNDAEAGYAAVLQVPWILMSSVSIQPKLEGLVDEVRSVATVPIIFNDSPIPMSFFKRLLNTIIYTGMVLNDWWDFSTHKAIYDDYFGALAQARGVVLPDYKAALHNISILLLNSHSSFSPATPLHPNVVEIAGFHIKDETPALPKDLQELLDSSPQGVVYFSMGSILKSSDLAPQAKKEILQVLGSLPQTVLWKFEENLDNLPKNVHIRSWMPQTSILAHPNVKVFMTHGGGLSTLESLRYGVPLIAIPVFGDQFMNANRAVTYGYALKVPFKPDMAKDIKIALDKMLTDDSYYKQVKHLSQLFNNRPVAPSKLISHYIEIAIETKGAYHLRSKSLLYSWHERLLLDVYATILLTIYILYLIVKKVIKLIYSLIVNKNKVKTN